MAVIRSGAFLFLFGGLLCLVPSERMPLAAMVHDQNESLTSALPEETGSYLDIAGYEDQFIAVGSNGRMDRITRSGEITHVSTGINVNLNSVIYVNQTIIAVGDGGTILASNDGQTCSHIESGSDKDINGTCYFKGTLIATADKGTILIPGDENNQRIIQLPIRGDIVSVSAGNSICFGVTDKGEIIKSFNGITWDIFDYNSEYAGYNKPCSFNKVLSAGKRIVIIGQHDDDSPVVLFSSLGNVWTERSLNYTDSDGKMCMLTNCPNDICYDAIEDQFFLACNNGIVMILPSCTKCNESSTFTENDLHAINCSENTLMIAGNNYYINTVTLR